MRLLKRTFDALLLTLWLLLLVAGFAYTFANISKLGPAEKLVEGIDGAAEEVIVSIRRSVGLPDPPHYPPVREPDPAYDLTEEEREAQAIYKALQEAN